LVFLSAVILPNRMQVVSASGAAKKAFSSPPFIASAFPQVCSVLSEPLRVAAAVWVQPRVLVAAVEQLHVVAAAVWVRPHVVALVSEQLRAVAVALEPLRVVAAVVAVQLHVAAVVVVQLHVVAAALLEQPRALVVLLECSPFAALSYAVVSS